MANKIYTEDSNTPSWGQEGSMLKGLKGLKYGDISTAYKQYTAQASPEEDAKKAEFFSGPIAKKLKEDYPDVDLEGYYLNKQIADTFGKDVFLSEYKDLPFEERQRKFFDATYEDESKLKRQQLDTLLKQVDALREKERLREEEPQYNPFQTKPDSTLSAADRLRSNIEQLEINRIPKFNAKEVGAIMAGNPMFGKYVGKEVDEYTKTEEYQKRYEDEVERQKKIIAFAEGISPDGVDDAYAASMVKIDIPKEYLKKYKEYNADINNYAISIYNNAIKSPESAKSLIDALNSAAYIVDPYFRDAYRGETEPNYVSFTKPFLTEEQKLKLASEYMAVVGATNNPDKASEFLSKRLTELRGESISGWKKAYDATKGIGADIAGSTLMLAGMVREVMDPIGLLDTDIDKDPTYKNITKDEASNSAWFNRMLYNISNNPITRWGDDMMKYGSVNPETLKKLKERDINLLDTSYSDWWTLYTQMGFTTASIAASVLAGGVVGAVKSGATDIAAGIMSKGGRVALTSAQKRMAVEIGKKWGQAAMLTIYPALVSYSEATMDGFETFDTALKEGKETLEKAALEDYEKRLDIDQDTLYIKDEDIRNYVYSKSPNFVKLYNFMNGYDSLDFLKGSSEGEMSELPENEAMRAFSDFQVSAIKELQDAIESYYKENYESILNSDEAKDRIMSSAIDAFGRNTIAEQIIVGFSDAFCTKVLGAGARNLRKSLGFETSQLLKKGANEYVQAAYNYGWKVSKDALIEGTEEITQTGIQGAEKALFNSDILNFFNSSFGKEETDFTGYGLFGSLNNIGTAFTGFINNTWSEEGFNAFRMGALGALMGAPSFSISTNYQRAMPILQDKSSTKLEKFAARLSLFHTSTITENILERREHLINSNKAAKMVNSLMETDPNFKSAVESYNGIISFADKFMRARANDDSVDMQESEFAEFVKGINGLIKLEGTKDVKRRLSGMDDFLKMSGDEEKVGDFVREVLRDELNKEENTKSDKELFKDLQNRVKEFKELYKQVKSKLDEVDNTYGGHIDDATKEAMVYSMLASENRVKMLSEREDRIKEAVKNDSFLNDETTPQSGLNKAQKVAIARWGNLKNAQEALSKEQERKKQGKSNLLESDFKRLRYDIEQLKSISEDTNSVLSAKEIFELNAEERAAMLNNKNSDIYSEAQRGELNKIKDFSFYAKDKATVQAINEAGKIAMYKRLNDDIFNDLVNSSDNITRLSGLLFQKSNYLNAIKKTKKAAEATTYEDFKREFDKASTYLNPVEAAMVGNIFNPKNPAYNFFKRYAEELDERKTIEGFIKEAVNGKINSKELQGLPYNNAIQATLKYIAGKELAEMEKDHKDYRLNYTTVMEALTQYNEELEKALEDAGIDFSNLTSKQIEEFEKELGIWINTINNALSNQATLLASYGEAVKKRIKKEEKNKKSTILNNKTYKDNQTYYDSLFDKVTKSYVDSSIKFSTQELYSLMSLFEDNLLSPIDAKIEGLTFSGKLNKFDLTRLKDTLIKKNNIYGDQAEYQSLLQFITNIDKVLALAEANNTSVENVIKLSVSEISQSAKDAFDTQEKEAKEKKTTRPVNWSREGKNFTISTLAQSDASITEKQKEWMDKINIDNNIAFLSTIDLKESSTILIETNEIKEDNEKYTSDNLPLAVGIILNKEQAARAEKEGINTVEHDGKRVLIAGIAQNGNGRNTDFLNIIREHLLSNPMESGESERVVRDNTERKDVVYFRAPYLVKAKVENPAEGTIENQRKNTKVSLKDYFKSRYNWSDDKVKEHIKAHTIQAKIKYTKQDDGQYHYIVVIEPRSSDNDKVSELIKQGKVEAREYDLGVATNPGADRTGLVYISDKSSAKQPIFTEVFTKEIGDITDSNGVHVEDLLTNPDVDLSSLNDSSVSWLKSLNNNIVNDLIHIKNDTIGKYDSFAKRKVRSTLANSVINEKKARDIRDALNQKISSAIKAYLSLASSEVQPLTVDIVNNTDDSFSLKIRINSTQTDDSGRKVIALAETDIDLKKDSDENIKSKVKDFIKDIILDKDNTIRVYSPGENVEPEPIAKLSVNYSNFSKLEFTGKEGDVNPIEYVERYIDDDFLYINSAYIETPNTEIIVRATAAEVERAIKKAEAEKRDKPLKLSPEEVKVMSKTLDKLRPFEQGTETNPRYQEGYVGTTTFTDTESSEEEQRKKIEVLAKAEKGEEELTDDEKKLIKKSENPATIFGTSVDFAVRTFFANDGDVEKTLEAIQKIQDKVSATLPKEQRRFVLPGFTGKSIRPFIESLSNLKDFFNVRGEVAVTFNTQFKADLVREIDGKKQTAKILAIPDILTIDKNGKLHIYDLKTFRIPGITSQTIIGPSVTGNETVYSATSIPIKMSLSDNFLHSIYGDNNDGKYRKQVSMYKYVIEKSTGLEVADIGIIPIPIAYESFLKSGYGSGFSISDINSTTGMRNVNKVSQSAGKTTVTPYTFTTRGVMSETPAIMLSSMELKDIPGPWDDTADTSLHPQSRPIKDGTPSLDDIRATLAGLRKKDGLRRAQTKPEVKDKADEC